MDALARAAVVVAVVADTLVPGEVVVHLPAVAEVEVTSAREAVEVVVAAVLPAGIIDSNLQDLFRYYPYAPLFFNCGFRVGSLFGSQPLLGASLRMAEADPA